MRDPSFDPTVFVGLGGITVKVLQDTSHRIAQISTVEAVEMTYELEAPPLFDGYRSSPAVAETIVTVSEVLSDNEEIREIEINPLLAESE